MTTKSVTVLPTHPADVSTLVATARRQATRRYIEFFTAEIRDPRTRRAYAGAVTKFFTWREQHGMTSLSANLPHL